MQPTVPGTRSRAWGTRQSMRGDCVASASGLREQGDTVKARATAWAASYRPFEYVPGPQPWSSGDVSKAGAPHGPGETGQRSRR